MTPVFMDEREILEGGINLHLHVGPDYMPRYGDSIKLATQAAEMGMRALALKTHLMSTVPHAYHANQVVEGTTCFGGITLNGPCGGLSPRTVAATIMAGGKIIWLPTTDAYYGAVVKTNQGHWIKSYSKKAGFGFPIDYITITDAEGKLKPEMHDILRLCKENDTILATGHISPEECIELAKESHAIGFKKLKITHPNLWMDDYTIPVMEDLVKLGATVSFAYGGLMPHHCRQDPAEIAEAVRRLGAKNVILVTDGGDVINPNHVQMFRAFYTLLKHEGIPVEDLNIMTKRKPAELLDLE